jgi:hypothetical protein
VDNDEPGILDKMSSKDVSAYKEYALGITMIPYDQNSF